MRITSKLGEFIKFLPVYNYLYNFIQQFLFLGIQDQRMVQWHNNTFDLRSSALQDLQVQLQMMS
jgi:hypothetical protein